MLEKSFTTTGVMIVREPVLLDLVEDPLERASELFFGIEVLVEVVWFPAPFDPVELVCEAFDNAVAVLAVEVGIPGGRVSVVLAQFESFG